MSDTHRSCRTCHSETQPKPLDPIAGEEKALKVTVHGLTVLTCANGHQQFTRAELPLELLNHLVEEAEPTLPAGEETGLLFKHFLCQSCGQELQPKPDHRHSFSFAPSVPDQPGLRIDLTMPVYRCSACDKEQLHSLKEVRKLTPAALAHAFQTAGIQSG